MKISEPDGSVRSQKTITNTWDDVGNDIAEGRLSEKDRAREIYKRMTAALNAERHAHNETKESLRKWDNLQAALRSLLTA